MDGVTILTTDTQSFCTTSNYLTIVLVSACVGLLVLSVLHYSKNTWEQVFAGVCGIVVLTIAFVCTLFFVCDTYPVYKITVDDTVSFNELTSRYDIISQDGKLFTVRELKEDNEAN